MIHSSNLPLFSDLSAYNLCAATKAGMMDEDTLLSLESLLDRSREVHDVNGIYRVTCIPFKEEYCSGNVSLTVEAPSFIPMDSLSRTKMFFVRTFNTDDNTSYDMVVTMIPDMECRERMEGRELSYFDKSEFSGLLLYSETDGTFLEAMYTKCYTPMAYAYPVTSADTVDDSAYDCSLYLSSGKSTPDTKAVVKVPISDMMRMMMEFTDGPSVTGAEGSGGENSGKNGLHAGVNSNGTIYGYYEGAMGVIVIPSQTYPVYYMDTGSMFCETNYYILYSGGGGGSSSSTATNNQRGRKSNPVDTYQYTVTLNASGKGTVSGGGVFPKNHKVRIKAISDYDTYFSHWSGDLAGYPDAFKMVVTSNIKATAVFRDSLSICSKLQGKEQYIEKLRAQLLKDSKQPLIKALLAMMDGYGDHLTAINIVDSIVYINPRTNTRQNPYGLTIPLGDGKYRIDVSLSDLTAYGIGSMSGLYEEYLHLIQYCEDKDWTTGDKEFEAKVFVALLHTTVGIYSSIADERIAALFDYYTNPSEKTYNNALTALAAVGYPQDGYPLTSGRDHSERLKHIKKLLAQCGK